MDYYLSLLEFLSSILILRMSNPLVKAAIRTKFVLTSRERASEIIRTHADAYRKLTDKIGYGNAAKPIMVPPMIGVDQEMRGWSFFQILEHNAIVNRSIASTVESLALGKEPLGQHSSIQKPMSYQRDSPDPIRWRLFANRSTTIWPWWKRYPLSAALRRHPTPSSEPSMPTSGTACLAFTWACI